MNILLNDLDMNATLDQQAMTAVLGGYKRHYGSWSRISSSSSFVKSRAYMGGKRRTGNLFQWIRHGSQYGTKRITVKYKRSVTDLSNIWGG